MNFMKIGGLKKASTQLSLFIKKQECGRSKRLLSHWLGERMYEIISKVLANILSIMVEKLKSKPQNAFVRDKQILDSMLIANECLESRLKLGDSGLLCKLDIKRPITESIRDSCFTCSRDVVLV